MNKFQLDKQADDTIESRFVIKNDWKEKQSSRERFVVCMCVFIECWSQMELMRENEANLMSSSHYSPVMIQTSPDEQIGSDRFQQQRKQLDQVLFGSLPYTKQSEGGREKEEKATLAIYNTDLVFAAEIVLAKNVC